MKGRLRNSPKGKTVRYRHRFYLIKEVGPEVSLLLRSVGVVWTSVVRYTCSLLETKVFSDSELPKNNGVLLDRILTIIKNLAKRTEHKRRGGVGNEYVLTYQFRSTRNED